MQNEDFVALINALILLHRTGGIARPNDELTKIEYTPEKGLTCYYQGEVKEVVIHGVIVGLDPAEEGGDQTITEEVELFDEDTGEKLH